MKLNAGHNRAVVLFEDLGDKGHHGDEDTVVYDHAGPTASDILSTCSYPGGCWTRCREAEAQRVEGMWILVAHFIDSEIVYKIKNESSGL